jgi:threonine dehydrogenase-like Zn-dependent dehydrogenase
VGARDVKTMRAAVLADVGRFEIRDVECTPPSDREVVVQVQAVGLCGTDLQIAAGHANYNRDDRGQALPLSARPQILGHEIAGVVTEVGRDVADVAPGERVIIDQGRTCVSEWRSPVCEYCDTGDSHQCAHYGEHGITGLPGGFAEYITVPAVNTVRITFPLLPERAALTEPLGCIVHAIEWVARAPARYPLRAARTILICGGGPAGLLFVQYLRRVIGFEGQLLVSEPSALRRGIVETFGAETIDPSCVDLVDAIAERTGGRRADIFIEASGSGSVFSAIPGVIRKQATVLLYGHGHSGVDLGVMNQVQFLEPTLVSPAGASGGHSASKRPITYEKALKLIEQGTIDVAPLITHRYLSLESLPGAFAKDHRQPDYLKGVLVMQQAT